jgi:hypothetical protein
MAGFKLDRLGLGEYLRSSEMEAEMRIRAERVKAEAERTAPYDPNSTDGTHYRDSFHVESTTHGGYHHDRAAAYVINDDNAAVFVEFLDQKNGPPHRTLGRALHAAGDI